MSGAGRATTWRRLAANQEVLLLALVALLLLVVSVRSPGFFSVETLFNVLRESVVDVLFATAVLVVLIAGGIDVSFLAVGIFAAYVTCTLAPAQGPATAAWVPFTMAAAIGVGLGLVNAAVVRVARVSTLIATLATAAIFTGTLFAFVGGVVITTIPEPLRALGQLSLVEFSAGRGTTRLSVLILPIVVVCLLVAAFLRYAVAGRSVYALGGDSEAARRTGVPVGRTTVLVFALAGALSALAGTVHVSLSGRADPTTFFGGELDVLAAVVLGGALITGGRGSVRGTILGVLVISVIKTSLIPLGIPSIWQQAVIGALLLLGVTLQALAARVRREQAVLAPDDPALRDRATGPPGHRLSAERSSSGPLSSDEGVKL